MKNKRKLEADTKEERSDSKHNKLKNFLLNKQINEKNKTQFVQVRKIKLNKRFQFKKNLKSRYTGNFTKSLKNLINNEVDNRLEHQKLLIVVRKFENLINH